MGSVGGAAQCARETQRGFLFFVFKKSRVFRPRLTALAVGHAGAVSVAPRRAAFLAGIKVQVATGTRPFAAHAAVLKRRAPVAQLPVATVADSTAVVAHELAAAPLACLQALACVTTSASPQRFRSLLLRLVVALSLFLFRHGA